MTSPADLDAALDAALAVALQLAPARTALVVLERDGVPTIVADTGGRRGRPARDDDTRGLVRVELGGTGALFVDADAPAETYRGVAALLTSRLASEQHAQALARRNALAIGESRLLAMVAAGRPLAVILDAVCRLVEELFGGPRTSIMLVTPDGRHLRPAAAPSLPPSYTTAFDGAPIGPDQPSCGAAAHGRRAVHAADTATDPRWARFRDVALAHGVRACWSSPIFGHDDVVLGTFAVCYPEVADPVAEQVEVIATVTHLASVAIERDRNERDLRRSQIHLAEAQRLLRAGSFAWVPDTGEIEWSDQCFEIFGFPLGSRPTIEAVAERVHPVDRDIFIGEVQRGLVQQSDWDFQERLLMPDGTIKHTHTVARAHVRDDGRFEVLGAVVDNTVEQVASEHLRASLREKEALLKEVHHRVKNNLQLISSLLNLQAARATDRTIAEKFADNRNRVRSMALVHENLYRAPDLGHVAMGRHLETLCAHLARAYADDRGRIAIEVAVRPAELELGLDRALSCGLIINELVSNALKHAFPGGRAGRVWVELEARDGGYALRVRDDGVGMPPVDLDRTGTIGLQLVHDLTGQLHASIAIATDGGARFEITFGDG